MFLIAAFLFYPLCVGLVAVVSALLLDKVGRIIPWKLRVLAATVLSGIVPVVLLLIFVSSLDNPAREIFDFTSIIVQISVLAVFIGFPFAYFISRRRERSRADDTDPTVFD